MFRPYPLRADLGAGMGIGRWDGLMASWAQYARNKYLWVLMLQLIMLRGLASGSEAGPRCQWSCQLTHPDRRNQPESSLIPLWHNAQDCRSARWRWGCVLLCCCSLEKTSTQNGGSSMIMKIMWFMRGQDHVSIAVLILGRPRRTSALPRPSLDSAQARADPPVRDIGLGQQTQALVRKPHPHVRNLTVRRAVGGHLRSGYG